MFVLGTEGGVSPFLVFLAGPKVIGKRTERRKIGEGKGRSREKRKSDNNNIMII
jgi:hypothetical protein